MKMIYCLTKQHSRPSKQDFIFSQSLNCSTALGQLILGKIINIVATRCHISRLKSGLLISKHRVSSILLSPKYTDTDTDTFPLPMSALIISESTEQRLHFISVNTCRIALICTLHVKETALRESS